MNNRRQATIRKVGYGILRPTVCSVRCAHDLTDSIARTAHATPRNEIQAAPIRTSPVANEAPGSKAASWNGDPSLIGVYGSSSGGHVAEPLGMRPRDARYNAIPLLVARTHPPARANAAEPKVECVSFTRR